MGVKYRILPFDIEKAKKGAKVTTVSGDDVRIICYDRYEIIEDIYLKRKRYPQPIVALVYFPVTKMEEIISYTEDGKHHFDKSQSRLDLVIVDGKMDKRYLMEHFNKIKNEDK